MNSYPWIDPILFDFGFIQIRWYSLAYIFGIIFGYFIFKKFNKNFLTEKQIDSLVNYSVIGIILGGRFGYVLFYNFNYYIQNPIEIFQIWNSPSAI